MRQKLLTLNFTCYLSPLRFQKKYKSPDDHRRRTPKIYKDLSSYTDRWYRYRQILDQYFLKIGHDICHWHQTTMRQISFVVYVDLTRPSLLQVSSLKRVREQSLKVWCKCSSTYANQKDSFFIKIEGFLLAIYHS